MANPIVSPEEQQITPELKNTPKAPESPGSRAVFPEGKSETTRALEQTLSSLNTKLDTLRKLQKEHPTPERQEQIAKLERQWGQAGRFAYLQARGSDDQKKILDKKASFEQLRPSDVLFLKKKWADLANLLLVPENNPTASVSRDAIKEKDSFIVNFGENKQVDNTIGAGDILPPTITKILVNGVEGERRNAPRPGYYDAKGKYLPVFDGYKIEIVKIGAIDEKMLAASNQAEESWFREQRIDDMASGDGKALSELPEDKELEEKAQEEVKDRRKRADAIRGISLSEKNDFLQNATIVAKAIEEQYGIPWQVTVGQAALESGYGKSGLAKAGNYFGIKWSGVTMSTKEVYNGQEVTEMASFRTYGDMKESFLGYAKFIAEENPRYRRAFAHAKPLENIPPHYPKDYNPSDYSPEKFLQEIRNAGYATDTNYVGKIVSLWKQNNIDVA